jgi:hypothetical protein
VVVLVRDAITNKRVARDVDLSNIPVDAHPRTIAVVAAELLRASWAELALSSAPPPARPVPPAVEETLASTIRAPSGAQPRAAAGLVWRLEMYGGKQTLFGPDIRTVVWFTDRLTVNMQVGLRWSPTVQAPDGVVSTSATMAAVGAGLALTPLTWRYGVELQAQVGLERIVFTGEPTVPGRRDSGSATAVIVRSGPSGWVAMGPTLRLFADVSLGAVLHSAQATDRGAVVTAVSGVEGTAGLGIAGIFR